MRKITSKDLLLKLQSLEDRPRVILIAGPSCAGKSHLANRLCQVLNGCIISGDNWALPKKTILAKFDRVDYESEKAYSLLEMAHDIDTLLRTGSVSHPRYDFVNDCNVVNQEIALSAKQTAIIEFIHAFNPLIVNRAMHFNMISIYVKSSELVCLLRRIYRDTQYRGKDLSSAVRGWIDSVHSGKIQETRLSLVADYVVEDAPTRNELQTILNYLYSSLQPPARPR